MKFGLQSTLLKKISRRYAQALFGLALEKNALELVYSDIVSLSQTLDLSPDLNNFIIDPQHACELCENILKEIFQGRLQPITYDFLMFLVQRGRLSILNEVIESFTKLYHKERGISKIQINSASQLTVAQIDLICKKLKIRRHHEIFAVNTIDPSLIGGFQIISGDEVLDFSMKNQLENFRKQVINA